MGIDIVAGGRKATKIKGRKGPVTENIYMRLLVKLYRFLARRTDSEFNALVLKRLFMSRTNRPSISIKTLAKHMSGDEEGKTAVVVGSVTDDSRLLEVPKLTVCALRFTNMARARITKAGGECMTFDQLALKAPTGENTKLLRGCKSHRETEKHYGAPGAPARPRPPPRSAEAVRRPPRLRPPLSPPPRARLVPRAAPPPPPHLLAPALAPRCRPVAAKAPTQPSPHASRPPSAASSPSALPLARLRAPGRSPRRPPRRPQASRTRRSSRTCARRAASSRRRVASGSRAASRSRRVVPSLCGWFVLLRTA